MPHNKDKVIRRTHEETA